MKRLLKWAIITFGIAALARWWRGRSSGDGTNAVETAETQAADDADDDPADELRRKLAETRTDEPGGEEAAEPSVDERRSEVHAEGRSAIDEMTSSTDD